MGIQYKVLVLVLIAAYHLSSFGQTAETVEFDPAHPQAEEMLREFDRVYEQETGESPFLFSPISLFGELIDAASSCYRESCNVFALVSKRNQKMYLHVGGSVQGVYDVSTGARGHTTPNFDKHPDGRIYNRYSSRTYPGGDYNGLGNMPYAVFIRGGYAIHGTPESNWPKLGQRASHGCIRVHPDNAYTFNRLVRANGVRQTWITVED